MATGNHRRGETLAFKAALVGRLIDRCGFAAVLFELERRRAAGEQGDQALLATAIGQLWIGDREFDPLLA